MLRSAAVKTRDDPDVQSSAVTPTVTAPRKTPSKTSKKRQTVSIEVSDVPNPPMPNTKKPRNASRTSEGVSKAGAEASAKATTENVVLPLSWEILEKLFHGLCTVYPLLRKRSSVLLVDVVCKLVSSTTGHTCTPTHLLQIQHVCPEAVSVVHQELNSTGSKQTSIYAVEVALCTGGHTYRHGSKPNAEAGMDLQSAKSLFRSKLRSIFLETKQTGKPHGGIGTGVEVEFPDLELPRGASSQPKRDTPTSVDEVLISPTVSCGSLSDMRPEATAEKVLEKAKDCWGGGELPAGISIEALRRVQAQEERLKLRNCPNAVAARMRSKGMGNVLKVFDFICYSMLGRGKRGAQPLADLLQSLVKSMQYSHPTSELEMRQALDVLVGVASDWCDIEESLYSKQEFFRIHNPNADVNVVRKRISQMANTVVKSSKQTCNSVTL
ncbi:hypothetical protein CYMTET_41928 [Cymbomonas tetramitiformis]|uniref:CDT1 Geminin-binding domain-containing protein n=1 Tax=Cymbomonas tetramitiformis TaxID=36881 RepID=A0AAE0C6U2_9CHLO|nr:hypothetical protein CYMTET_41928 [Cymbomonas tetramitiformis]